jgi:hypothetical protein
LLGGFFSPFFGVHFFSDQFLKSRRSIIAVEDLNHTHPQQLLARGHDPSRRFEHRF